MADYEFGDRILAQAEEEGRWQDVVDRLLHHTESSDAADRMAAYLRLGVVAKEELGDIELAMSSIRSALELDPSNAAALELMTRLCEQVADSEQLVDVLERRIDLADETDEHISFLVRVAQIYEEGLDEATRAMDAWQRVLDIDAGHARAQRELERLRAAVAES